MAYSSSYIMYFEHHKYKPIQLNTAMAKSQRVQSPKVNMPTLLFHYMLDIARCRFQQEAKHASTKDDKQLLRKARRAWEAVEQEPYGRHVLWLPGMVMT